MKDELIPASNCVKLVLSGYERADPSVGMAASGAYRQMENDKIQEAL